MDKLTLKEEMQILNAAEIAGKEAPEVLDTQRARGYVRSQLQPGNSRRRSFFRSPVIYVALAVAACAVAVLLIFTPDSEASLQLMQQEQMHAAADSIDCADDSLAVETSEQFEIASVDE